MSVVFYCWQRYNKFSKYNHFYPEIFLKHNQHRRAEWQDYNGTGLYMITLCIEGRHGLFGYIEGDIRAQRGSSAFPQIVLSALGHAVMEEELPKIHRLYPQIELWQAAIMPDHLHFFICC